IDPNSNSYVIFLSSRLYPDGLGDVTPLRSRVATVAAAAIYGGGSSGPPKEGGAFTAVSVVRPVGTTAVEAPASLRVPTGPVLTGIDVLARDGFKQLRGKKIGLLTNHTGRSRDGKTTIDLLHAAPGVQLVALFSPEHGIRGILDEDVPASKDDKTGLP